MGINVSVEVVKPRKLAAVRRGVSIGSVGSAWRPALDQVWAFLRSQPGLRTDGHNIFLYHHPAHPGDLMNGTSASKCREASVLSEKYETSTPAGEAAIAIHRGGYDQLHGAHDAIHEWTKSHDRIFAGRSWEIYGDPSDDPLKIETTVVYLLA